MARRTARARTNRVVNTKSRFNKLDLLFGGAFIIIAILIGKWLYQESETLKLAYNSAAVTFFMATLALTLSVLYAEIHKLDNLIKKTRNYPKLSIQGVVIEGYRLGVYRNLIFILISVITYFLIKFLLIPKVDDYLAAKLISSAAIAIIFFLFVRAFHLLVISLYDAFEIEKKVDSYILKREKNKKKAKELREAREKYPLQGDDHTNGYLKLHNEHS